MFFRICCCYYLESLWAKVIINFRNITCGEIMSYYLFCTHFKLLFHAFVSADEGGRPAGSSTAPNSLTLVCNKFISTYCNINACCIMPCRDIVSFLKSTCTGQNSQWLQVTINAWFWAVFLCFTRFSFETRISFSQIILSYLLHRSYLILLCCLCI